MSNKPGAFVFLGCCWTSCTWWWKPSSARNPQTLQSGEASEKPSNPNSVSEIRQVLKTVNVGRPECASIACVFVKWSQVLLSITTSPSRSCCLAWWPSSAAVTPLIFPWRKFCCCSGRPSWWEWWSFYTRKTHFKCSEFNPASILKIK